mmetsp:Transcript_33023/g.66244  ORF Transcript_33023/g.66244 Transcript_33023/m.66244 type:complete len:203 (+) Transcript_33023:246-854(+)
MLNHVENQDEAILVTREELEAERVECSARLKAESALPAVNRIKKRVPKAGHYPHGYSPYLLGAPSSTTISLSRLDVRQDFQLIKKGYEEEFKSTYFEESGTPQVAEVAVCNSRKVGRAHPKTEDQPAKRHRTSLQYSLSPTTKADEARQVRAALKASIQDGTFAKPRAKARANLAKGEMANRFHTLPNTTSPVHQLLLLQKA